MFKTPVYQGDSLLGEVDIDPQNTNFNVMGACKTGIRISYLSPQSERCPPLAVLHTISSCGLCFKMEFLPQSELESPLVNLYNTCLRENKTAVVLVGQEELHLVAMPSRQNLQQFSCFWGFNVALGLYNSCLVMLNLRCLGIVFDLDETLIVANTMRSFEDRIDALQRKISSEMDPQRVSVMLAEVKRYQDDKTVLKQYVENDQVLENGKVIKVQSEIVHPLSDNHQPIVRPIIRLQERNIILTRINPVIRDTSVLVRLRPAWEDLRNYLTARGRKRFEVYVCTMAERDYALEMWRLLDPESHLISSKELLARVVCVKAGSRKSLLNVFQDGICHPKMAMVIDDRLKVWDDKDQPRVHVVPAFAPYYAPQAEANNAVPVLCVARNVACNVRGGFFKEFDEGLLQWISDVFYEDDKAGFPSAPDVSSYLLSEEDASVSNGNNPLAFDGMADAEVERRLKDVNYNMLTTPNSTVGNLDPRSTSSLPQGVVPSSNTILQPTSQGSLSLLGQQCSLAISPLKPLGHVAPSESCLQGSPAREEGEVPESELDPDTRRRLLILQHGQDTREHNLNDPPFSLRPPVQIAVAPVQSRGSWFPLDEETSPRQLNIPPREFSLEPEALHFDKKRSHHSSFYHGLENPVSFDRAIHDSQRLPKEVQHGDDRFRQNQPYPSCSSFQGEMAPFLRSSTSPHFESGRVTSQFSETPCVALQEIAMKCGTKVEFRPILNSGLELQFSVEVWFTGEKVGEGIGRTRKEAQHQASESSLRNLANKYLSRVSSDPGTLHGDSSKLSHGNENGFLGDSNSFGPPALPREDPLPITSASQQSRLLDQRLEGPKRSLAALEELCTMKDLPLMFMPDRNPSITPIQKGEAYAQIEVGGQVLGKGVGSSWEEAKLQAAEEALTSLRSSLGQHAMKRFSSPRSPQAVPNKRLKPPESMQGLQRIPSMRYSKSGPPVP